MTAEAERPLPAEVAAAIEAQIVALKTQRQAITTKISNLNDKRRALLGLETPAPKERPKKDLRLRMQEKSVLDTASGCFVWTGSLNEHGYGKVWDGKKPRRAHVLAWEAANGSIPEGLVIDHVCRNRACVNPDHMRLLTLVENVMIGESPCARHARKVSCPAGHPYSFIDERKRRRCGVCEAARRNSRWQPLSSPAMEASP